MTDAMSISGYAIVPPLSPWDEKHKAEIWLRQSYSTFGLTAGEAWRKHCQTNQQPLSPGDLSARIQHWMDRGYRLVNARYEIMDADALSPTPVDASDGAETDGK